MCRPRRRYSVPTASPPESTTSRWGREMEGLPEQAPVLLVPQEGEAVDPLVLFEGTSQSGVSVSIEVDGAEVARVPLDAQQRFSYTLTAEQKLASGPHTRAPPSVGCVRRRGPLLHRDELRGEAAHRARRGLWVWSHVGSRARGDGAAPGVGRGAAPAAGVGSSGRVEDEARCRHPQQIRGSCQKGSLAVMLRFSDQAAGPAPRRRDGWPSPRRACRASSTTVSR